jgi:hypothetical protein
MPKTRTLADLETELLTAAQADPGVAEAAAALEASVKAFDLVRQKRSSFVRERQEAEDRVAKAKSEARAGGVRLSLGDISANQHQALLDELADADAALASMPESVTIFDQIVEERRQSLSEALDSFDLALAPWRSRIDRAAEDLRDAGRRAIYLAELVRYRAAPSYWNAPEPVGRMSATPQFELARANRDAVQLREEANRRLDYGLGGISGSHRPLSVRSI